MNVSAQWDAHFRSLGDMPERPEPKPLSIQSCDCTPCVAEGIARDYRHRTSKEPNRFISMEECGRVMFGEAKAIFRHCEKWKEIFSEVRKETL